MTLKTLLTQPLQLPNSLVIVALIVAVVGFADATYLTIEHYQNVIPPCTVGGCETVLTSDYSTVGGIPVSLGGSIYYLLVAIGLFAFLDTKNNTLLRYTMMFTICGFLASLYFLYLQMFVIHAYCLYCLGSAITSTTLFVIAVVAFTKYSRPPSLPQ